jgi:hypothetical protein
VHKLFARQLAKATTSAGEVDLTVLGDLVGAAYEEMEGDRRRTDRSLSLMVAELDKHLLDRERDTELLSAQKLQLDAALNNMTRFLPRKPRILSKQTIGNCSNRGRTSIYPNTKSRRATARAWSPRTGSPSAIKTATCNMCWASSTT